MIRRSNGLARRAIAINPNIPREQGPLIAALALSGQVGEAHEALQRYLALTPTRLMTIADRNAFKGQRTNEHSDQRILELWDRQIDGLRKAGMSGQ